MFLTHAAAPRFLPSGGARGWRALAPPPRPPRPSRWRGLAAGQLRHAASVCVRIKISGGGAYFCVHLTEPGRLGDTSCLGEAGVRLRGQSEDPPSAVCGNVVRFIEARMEGNGNETVGSRLEPGSHAPDLRSQGTWGSSGRGFRAPLTYLSPTSHLPILYQSSIIYRSSIYRSPIDHLSLPVPRLWRTMTSAELSRPEQEDEAGTASHVRVAPTAPPCAARHRCGRGGSFASPRRKRSAHLLRGSPFATNLDASPTHRNGGGSSAVPPPPRGCPGPAGGGGGRAWR